MESEIKRKEDEEMNNATSQYRQYLKAYATKHHCTLKEASETAICKEYQEYCEAVYGRPVCADEAIGEREQDVQEQ